MGRRRRFEGAQSKATLDRLLDATQTLLARRGYDALSMRGVAAKSGITPGAIYKHFPNKDAMVQRVVERALADFEHTLLRAIAPLPVGSFERVVALGASYIRFALENEEHFKVLFTRLGRKPRKLADLPGQGGYAILRQCVVEAIESGRFRRADPDLTAFYLWSRVHGIVMLMLACDLRDTLPLKPAEVTPQSLFDLTREFVVDGLRARDMPPGRRTRGQPATPGGT